MRTSSVREPCSLSSDTAHRDAYVHFGLLHCDISAGNMMILPRIEEQDGKKRVTWRGVLIDWELAKYVPKDDSARRARQPERTVRTCATEWINCD